jgi:membrane fusion protein (multidrug efflux system)
MSIRQLIAGCATAGLCLTAQAQAQAAHEAAAIRAQLTPQRYATLSAELGAKIARIHVREGERFREGQPLVSFECSLQDAQLEKTKAQVFATQGTFEGNQRLVKFNAIGDVELRNSEAELLKAKAEQSYLQATVSKCQIHAPYAGRAGEWKAREQQFVQPGQPVLEIVDDSSLELEFILPTAAVAGLRAAGKFRVLIDDTQKTYPVRFLRAGAKADPVSQTIKVIAVLEGHHPELMAGMSGRVRLGVQASK